jgi:hypothetical protein
MQSNGASMDWRAGVGNWESNGILFSKVRNRCNNYFADAVGINADDEAADIVGKSSFGVRVMRSDTSR